MESNNGRNVQVILKTQTSYQIPAEPYMLPIAFRRYHLSQLINQVLSLPTPVPFDFIINGEILSSTLGDWCVEKNLGEVRLFFSSVVFPLNIITSCLIFPCRVGRDNRN
jgi:NLE (NUC135) domain